MSCGTLEPFAIYSSATFLAKAHKNDRKHQCRQKIHFQSQLLLADSLLEKQPERQCSYAGSHPPGSKQQQQLQHLVFGCLTTCSTEEGIGLSDYIKTTKNAQKDKRPGIKWKQQSRMRGKERQQELTPCLLSKTGCNNVKRVGEEDHEISSLPYHCDVPPPNSLSQTQGTEVIYALVIVYSS